MCFDSDSKKSKKCRPFASKKYDDATWPKWDLKKNY